MSESLAKLYRIVLRDNHVAARTWPVLLDRYCLKHKERIHSIPNFSGNLIKAILRPRLSFINLERALAIFGDVCYFGVSLTVEEQGVEVRYECRVLLPKEPYSNTDLTGLHRNLLAHMDVGPDRWSEILRDFVSSPLYKQVYGNAPGGQFKASLTKAIAQKHITFGFFVRALAILKPKTIDVFVDVGEGESVIRHSVSVNPLNYLRH